MSEANRQDVMLWVNSRWQQTLMFLFLHRFTFTHFIWSELEERKRILNFSESSKTTMKYSFTSQSPAFKTILKLWEIKCSEYWNSWVFLSDMWWRKSRSCVHQSSHNTVTGPSMNVMWTDWFDDGVCIFSIYMLYIIL